MTAVSRGQLPFGRWSRSSRLVDLSARLDDQHGDDSRRSIGDKSDAPVAYPESVLIASLQRSNIPLREPVDRGYKAVALVARERRSAFTAEGLISMRHEDCELIRTCACCSWSGSIERQSRCDGAGSWRGGMLRERTAPVQAGL